MPSFAIPGFPPSRRAALIAAAAAAAVVLIVVGIVVLSGGGGGGTPLAVPSSPVAAATSASPTPSVAASSSSAPAGAVSPLTGLAGGGGPVLAVKIDNTSRSRPQVGVDDADVVYVEQVEGGLTRLMGIYNSQLPELVGPVRSGRENDVELLAEYGHVGLAYSGANRHVVPIIRSAPLVDLSWDRATSAYKRDHSRPSPYNLFIDPAKALAGSQAVAAVRDVGFTFGDPVKPGETAGRVDVKLSPSVTFGFDYDPASGHYLESMSGKQIKAAGGEVQWGDNVIVQEVDVHPSKFHDVNGANTPFSDTVGTGRFWLFRDGQVLTGTWSRPAADGPTAWTDASGSPVPLKAGRTWVLLKGKGLSVRVS